MANAPKLWKWLLRWHVSQVLVSRRGPFHTKMTIFRHNLHPKQIDKLHGKRYFSFDHRVFLHILKAFNHLFQFFLGTVWNKRKLYCKRRTQNNNNNNSNNNNDNDNNNNNLMTYSACVTWRYAHTRITLENDHNKT